MTDPTPAADPAMPYYLVEVTVAAAVVGADDRLVGDNMTDVTLQFGWRADDVPAGESDERTQERLRRLTSLVIPIIQGTMTLNKWAFFGQTDTPMAENRGRVVGYAKTEALLSDLPHGIPSQPVLPAEAEQFARDLLALLPARTATTEAAEEAGYRRGYAEAISDFPEARTATTEAVSWAAHRERCHDNDPDATIAFLHSRLDATTEAEALVALLDAWRVGVAIRRVEDGWAVNDPARDPALYPTLAAALAATDVG